MCLGRTAVARRTVSGSKSPPKAKAKSLSTASETVPLKSADVPYFFAMPTAVVRAACPSWIEKIFWKREDEPCSETQTSVCTASALPSRRAYRQLSGTFPVQVGSPGPFEQAETVENQDAPSKQTRRIRYWPCGLRPRLLGARGCAGFHVHS